MDYFPVFMRLEGQPVVLVGGGEIATRKARLLSRAGAVLTVIAPQVAPELLALLDDSGGRVRLRQYQPGDLDGAVLAVAATDIAEVNERVSRDARARQLPVNVVDSPALCTVITPAIVDRSPLLIAISSGGEAPVLARMVRTRLEALFPAAYGRLAGLASRWRERVKQRFASGDERRRFWESALNGPAAEQAYNGRDEQADRLMEEQLAADSATLTQGEARGMRNCSPSRPCG